MDLTVSINNLVHPTYQRRYRNWEKYRLTYESGELFIDRYLQRFSKGEDVEDFKIRKNLSYCPAFAKAAVIEVKNSIYQRLVDITRQGGSATYEEAVAGRENGVDLLGSSMNAFIGTEVLPELLSLGRVGIYVDMPPKKGLTVAENQGVRPYVYIYKTEDIRTWDFDESPTPNLFRAILLRDYVYTYDELTKLPNGQEERFRFYYVQNNEVFVQLFNYDGKPVDFNNNLLSSPQSFILEGLKRIPFVLLELEDSLLTDISDYQIALLNLASSDMAYAVGANFPFYVEQFDPRFSSPHVKRGPAVDEDDPIIGSNAEELKVGPSSGRRYPVGTEQPAFIFPSPEPMKASMAKQEQLKMEIRLLINLAITNIQPKMASAESKGFDERTLESGLSYIGLILEDAERQVAELWRMYEGTNLIATVNYPEKYDLRSDEDRRKEAQDLRKLLGDIPSQTYQREIAKQIAMIMLGSRVSFETLKEILDEIDTAEIVNVIPDQIDNDLKAGIVDPETASKARGYPDGCVDKAQEYQAKRLELIQKAQSNPAARGIPDMSANPSQDAALEKIGKSGRGAVNNGESE
jgi:hypothetical protein